MTNQELAERIIGDLNELIDKRGNTALIPALIEVRKFLDQVHSLRAEIAVLESYDDAITRDPDYNRKAWDQMYDDDPLD